MSYTTSALTAYLRILPLVEFLSLFAIAHRKLWQGVNFCQALSLRKGGHYEEDSSVTTALGMAHSASGSDACFHPTGGDEETELVGR